MHPQAAEGSNAGVPTSPCSPCSAGPQPAGLAAQHVAGFLVRPYVCSGNVMVLRVAHGPSPSSLHHCLWFMLFSIAEQGQSKDSLLVESQV